MKTYEVKWTAKNGQEIKVVVLNGYNCLVTLAGVELARGELTRIGNGEIRAVVGKVGMNKENCDRLTDVILQKMSDEETSEQKAHDAEMRDYDNHCEMMHRTMSI